MFISAFTQSAQTAYALSNLFRSAAPSPCSAARTRAAIRRTRGRYFDYVLGFTDRETVPRGARRLRRRIARSGRQLGAAPAAARAARALRERWKFIEPTLAKAPVIKIVPMLGSLGCPYTCSFCIDSTVPTSRSTSTSSADDLRFLLTKIKRPDRRLARPELRRPLRRLHGRDRSGGARRAASASSPRAACRCSPSRTSSACRSNGFKAILPGIESWYDLGNKSKTGARTRHGQGRRRSPST